ncbi:DUF2339 domain-containing protein [Skermania piniformis]|uniref:DUF2339 domain-containing protein n=1 Tax=Skermania pinensis TaxID=39122 RepID=A0ABX8SBD1_9ACTN|nr:DUF2339 domain-containing protein [Skermania piniformis]QXQ13755.1 DUF2339 domain-containing protein [Skermania piniformis]
MTIPTPPPMIDPRLVARVYDQFAVLNHQLGALGRDLTLLRQQAGPIAPAPAQPPYVPAAHQQPAVPPPMPLQPRPVVAARPKPEPWWQRDGVISRLLAAAGAGVTLIGVALLLVLAAQAGFFGPIPRVIGGGLLAVALVEAGRRVYGRAGGRVGGIALAATGIAAAFLDIVAMTTIYHWLTPAVGLTVALAITAGGVALATHWQTQQLALIVVGGAAALAPVVTGGLSITLIAFLLVLQIGCIPAQLSNNWPYLHVARTVPVVLALLGGIAAGIIGSSGRQEHVQLLTGALLAAIGGVAGAILVTRRHPGDRAASALLAVAVLPLLVSGSLFDRPFSALAPAATAILLLALAALRPLVWHLRLVALLAGSLALLQTWAAVTDAALFTTSLLATALGYAAVAEQTRQRAVAVVAVGFAGLGVLGFVGIATLDALTTPSAAVQHLDSSVILAAAVGCAALAALGRAARHTGLITVRFADLGWAVLSAVALYLVTAGTIAAGVAIGGATGFVAGQGIATIAWMTAATLALGYGLRAGRNAHAALVAGLALTAAALAKLFLFDLATLSGLIRVTAFLMVGLLLLGVGTRYARAFADRDDPVTDDAAGAAARRH